MLVLLTVGVEALGGCRLNRWLLSRQTQGGCSDSARCLRRGTKKGLFWKRLPFSKRKMAVLKPPPGCQERWLFRIHFFSQGGYSCNRYNTLEEDSLSCMRALRVLGSTEERRGALRD